MDFRHSKINLHQNYFRGIRELPIAAIRPAGPDRPEHPDRGSGDIDLFRRSGNAPCSVCPCPICLRGKSTTAIPGRGPSSSNILLMGAELNGAFTHALPGNGTHIGFVRSHRDTVDRRLTSLIAMGRAATTLDERSANGACSRRASVCGP